MLKWICLTLVILNLLLIAFAGFRLMTVPPSHVEALREGRDPYATQATEEPVRRAARWNSEATEDAPPPPPRAENGDAPAEGTTRAERSPALNVEAFGVSRERGRLAEIERQQEAKDALSEEAFD